MIRINLLPVREERRKADLQQFAVLLVASLVGSLVIAGFFHWKLSRDITTTRLAVTETQRQIDAFKPQMEQVERYRETKAEIEQKLEVIERLEESRSGPVHVMDELATHAPDRLWLTRIQARGREITIEGMSLDNELVAIFLTALNDSAYFKDVELRETQAKEKEGFKLNEFKLSAAITSPASEARDSGRTGAGQEVASAAGATPAGTAR